MGPRLLAAVLLIAACSPPPPATKLPAIESAPQPTPAAVVEPGPCRVVAQMINWRYDPTATVLLDGRILVAGGRHHDGDEWLTDVEYFDPKTSAFTRAPPMHYERAEHSAVMLRDGRVLVAGSHPVVEMFDPRTHAWKDVGEVLPATNPSMTVLRDGRVFLAGGEMMSRPAISPNLDLFDPVTGAWKRHTIDGERPSGDVYRMPNGHVLTRVFALWDGDAPATEYDPFANTWSIAPPYHDRMWQKPSGVRVEHLVVHRDGRPRTPLTYTTTSGIFEWDDAARGWHERPFVKEHEAHAVALLDDGRLFVVGHLRAPSEAEICPLIASPE